jgi:hypothetical protein
MSTHFRPAAKPVTQSSAPCFLHSPTHEDESLKTQIGIGCDAKTKEVFLFTHYGNPEFYKAKWPDQQF